MHVPRQQAASLLVDQLSKASRADRCTTPLLLVLAGVDVRDRSVLRHSYRLVYVFFPEPDVVFVFIVIENSPGKTFSDLFHKGNPYSICPRKIAALIDQIEQCKAEFERISNV